jgi:hypothetical protein
MRQRPVRSFALHPYLALAFCLLATHAVANAQTNAPPDAAEQERILTLIRQYAASYRMPDVAYDQTITSSEAPVGSNQWRIKGGSDSSRMAHDGREYWCCATYRSGGRTRKPPAHAQWKEAGLYSFDTFQAVATRAAIVWDRWEILRARRFAVFNYSVSLRDSEWEMGRAVQRGSDWTTIKYGVNVPYSGSIYVDPATGAIWRYAEVIAEIPARFKFTYASNIVDYDLVTIGTAQYLLPMTHSSIVRKDTDWRDEWVFRNYHKFDADSSITFFGADSSITYKK